MQATQLSPAIGDRMLIRCHEHRCTVRNRLLIFLEDLVRVGLCQAVGEAAEWLARLADKAMSREALTLAYASLL